MPPECPPPTFGTNAQGVPFMQIVVQDADTGLAKIDITWAKNLTVDIAGFNLGTTAPVTVTGTAIDPAADIGLTFIATDLAGNQTTCDPVLAPLGREVGSPVSQTFTHLLEDEGNVTISNGSPGIGSVELLVNGTAFRVAGLADGETHYLDISSALLPGANNVVTVTTRGRPGGSAMIFISN
jgi:hypothetical protein